MARIRPPAVHLARLHSTSSPLAIWGLLLAAVLGVIDLQRGVPAPHRDAHLPRRPEPEPGAGRQGRRRRGGRAALRPDGLVIAGGDGGWGSPSPAAIRSRSATPRWSATGRQPAGRRAARGDRGVRRLIAQVPARRRDRSLRLDDRHRVAARRAVPRDHGRTCRTRRRPTCPGRAWAARHSGPRTASAGARRCRSRPLRRCSPPWLSSWPRSAARTTVRRDVT